MWAGRAAVLLIAAIGVGGCASDRGLSPVASAAPVEPLPRAGSDWFLLLHPVGDLLPAYGLIPPLPGVCFFYFEYPSTPLFDVEAREAAEREVLDAVSGCVEDCGGEVESYGNTLQVIGPRRLHEAVDGVLRRLRSGG